MKPVRANWESALLVCGKCSRRLDGGFGPKGRTRLAKLLRGLPGFGKGRKARIGVIETKCLGICPKRGVVLVDTRTPRRWLVVAPGTDTGELVEHFGNPPL